MYEDFYQLEKAPFQITPDPEFLYLSPSHKEALASIVYGIEQRKGFVAVLGEVGLGKTTVLRYFLARHDAKRLTTAYVFNANVTFKALLDIIYQELGIADKLDDVFGMVNRLHQVVIEEYRQGRNVVLIVDEAQNMPTETLENLRVLSNLETSTDKLLQIVLVGQPEFADRLDLRELRQLKQRIAVRSTLVPFTDRESLDYIEYRLNKVGGSSASVFTRGALRRIVKHARGNPRMLNIVCDNALVTGLGYQTRPVTARIVREVIADLTGHVRVRRFRRVWASLAVVLAAGALFLASPYREFLRPGPDIGMKSPSPPPPPTRLATELSRGLSPLPAPEDDGSPAETIQPALDAATLQPAEQPLVVTRVVKEGDTLLRMVLDIYGIATQEVLQRVVEHNPGITDVNRILVGSAIHFPDVSDLQARKPGSTSRGQ